MKQKQLKSNCSHVYIIGARTKSSCHTINRSDAISVKTSMHCQCLWIQENLKPQFLKAFLRTEEEVIKKNNKINKKILGHQKRDFNANLIHKTVSCGLDGP